MVNGCGRPYRACGLCSSHLDQLARGKDLTPIREPNTSFEFPGCDRKHAGNGLCTGHKSQLHRGQPLRPIGAGFRLAWHDRKGYVPTMATLSSQECRGNAK
jgi:hypothetical protein